MKTTLDVKKAFEKRLLKIRNVVGTAVGRKFVNGLPTEEPAVLVFVERKISTRGLSKLSADIIPDNLDGVVTDVIEVGKLVKQASPGYKSKVRPIKPGYSCGHGSITAGTIGGLFTDGDGDIVILSNNHVLANENNAKAGDIIYQPGPYDYRGDKTFKGWTNPADIPYFATLKKFVKLQANNNTHDSAIATVSKAFLDSGMVTNSYPEIGKPLAGWEDVKVGESVQKCGRTTGYTTGRVLGLHATFTISYDMGAIKFTDCIVLTPMSDGGDSGSIISDLDMNAIGLLFAGSQKVTIANPIIPVRDYYKLSIWNGTNKPNIQVDGFILVVRHSKAAYTNGVLTIEDCANHSCYLERQVQSFNCISCTINTGTDQGQTWGPGISIIWPNGYIETNLRYNGTFGAYYAGQSTLTIGKTKPNYDYKVRFIKEGGRLKGQVYDNNTWFTVIEVPDSVIRTPITVRIGKTDMCGGSGDYPSADGPIGRCSIRDIKIS